MTLTKIEQAMKPIYKTKSKVFKSLNVKKSYHYCSNH